MTTADKRITVYSDERIPRQIFEWQPVGLRIATEFVRTLRRLRRQHAGELDDGTVWIECEAPGGWSYGVKPGDEPDDLWAAGHLLLTLERGMAEGRSGHRIRELEDAELAASEQHAPLPF